MAEASYPSGWLNEPDGMQPRPPMMESLPWLGSTPEQRAQQAYNRGEMAYQRQGRWWEKQDADFERYKRQRDAMNALPAEFRQWVQDREKLQVDAMYQQYIREQNARNRPTGYMAMLGFGG